MSWKALLLLLFYDYDASSWLHTLGAAMCSCTLQADLPNTVPSFLTRNLAKFQEIGLVSPLAACMNMLHVSQTYMPVVLWVIPSHCLETPW